MAYASADRRGLWSAKTAVELRQKSIMYNLFDRSWEQPWVDGAKSVSVAVPAWATSVVASARARGGNWASNTDGSQTTVELTRSGGYSARNDIDWEDAMELPWDVVERYRERQIWQLRHSCDVGMYTGARAAASTTITGGAAGSTYVPNSHNYIATIASGHEHPVTEAIMKTALQMNRANALGGDPSPTGGPRGYPFIILQPELVTSYAVWLKNQGLAFDPLTADLLHGNVAGMEGVSDINMYLGVLIISWNHLTVPTGTNNWLAYAGMMEACAVGIRPPLVQYHDPGDNQVASNPAHTIRSAGDYAFVEVVDGLHAKVEIEAN